MQRAFKIKSYWLAACKAPLNSILIGMAHANLPAIQRKLACRMQASFVPNCPLHAAGKKVISTSFYCLRLLLIFTLEILNNLILSTMTLKLEPIELGKLSNAEAGKLVTSTLSVFEALPPAGPQDDFSVIQFYVDKLAGQHSNYLLSFNQTRANKDTDEIERLDNNRDQAMKAFRRFVKASQYLDTPADATAAHALLLLMNGYEDTETLSYEGESETIDKLLVELTGKYALNVKQLGLDRLVTRLQTANNAFKTLYNSRTNTVALEQTGNARTLRLEMLKTYREFTLYVQAMANTPMGGYFVQLLSLINQVRKNYAVLIAQRQGVSAAKEKKGEPDPLLQ